MWLYLLKQKSDIYQVFHNFQNLVERKFNKKIISMQTDWGGEYEKLNSFFQRIGIAHRVSCPHAHQQNDLAERKHRHIVEVGLALLANASMPLKFWDEAFLTSTYLINILPSIVINFHTPIELLSNEKPDYTSQRIFGCACWPNLRPYNTRKLSFRSTRCVFLGYSALHKGFKCLEPSTGRVYISKNVVFDETIFPFAHLHNNAGALLRKEILLLPNHILNPNCGDGSCIDPLLSDSTNINSSNPALMQEENSEENTNIEALSLHVLQPLQFPAATDPSSASQGDSPRGFGTRSQEDSARAPAPAPPGSSPSLRAPPQPAASALGGQR
jgi:hypothetical protein